MIAEQRIRDAMDAGQFQNLPGHGKPLRFGDETCVPDELRMAYKILKNANLLPPELEMRREISHLQDLIACCTDDHEVCVLRKKLTLKQLKLELALEKSGTRLPDAYADRVHVQLSERSGLDA